MEARFIRREHLPFQARLETVDEDTRRPEAGQLDHRHGSELNQRPERHPLEVQAGCRDILAQVTRCDPEARFREESEELGRDQVDLSEGYAGPAAGQITVSDKWTCVWVCSFIPAVRSGARRTLAPGLFRRAKSMPLMLQSRSRRECRWGRSDSEEASASSHSSGRAIFDPAALISNTFDIEWPPRTGRRQSFPEVDRAEWFDIDLARTKMLSAQVELLDRLSAIAAESNIE
jgi:hypothetical protein